MSQELVAIGGEAYYCRQYGPWAVIVETAVHLGMMRREGLRCPQLCDCDPGLAGIPVNKVCGNTGHLVTPREVAAALAAFRAWDGDLTDVVVHPFARPPSRLGREGAEDFLEFVDFLRDTLTEGFAAY